MRKSQYNLLLADDDDDDCTFFKEALDGLKISVTLTTVNNGVELMDILSTNIDNFPDAIFLDLNMPRKTGLECLEEIKAIDKLRSLPIFILSTSMDVNVVNLLYARGAHYYIRKPGEFSNLKKVIHQAVDLLDKGDPRQPPREKFILYP